MPTILIELAGGEPTGDGEIEHDVPDGGSFTVFIAEFYGCFRDEFFCAEVDGRIACFLRDEFGLYLKHDDERAEENADGASTFEERVRIGQGKGYVTRKGIGRSGIADTNR